MGEKKKYQTKQKAEVLSFLETIPGEHVTVAQAYEKLKSSGCAIGSTTVYRCLEHLVDEGIVKKYTIDGSSPACFEYIGMPDARAADGSGCYHCKCERCGRLVHLHCGEVDSLVRHLREEHHFTIDPFRTVFYGICDECRDEEETE